MIDKMIDNVFIVKMFLPYRLLNAHYFGNNSVDIIILYIATLLPVRK